MIENNHFLDRRSACKRILWDRFAAQNDLFDICLAQETVCLISISGIIVKGMEIGTILEDLDADVADRFGDGDFLYCGAIDECLCGNCRHLHSVHIGGDHHMAVGAGTQAGHDVSAVTAEIIFQAHRAGCVEHLLIAVAARASIGCGAIFALCGIHSGGFLVGMGCQIALSLPADGAGFWGKAGGFLPRMQVDRRFRGRGGNCWGAAGAFRIAAGNQAQTQNEYEEET